MPQNPKTPQSEKLAVCLLVINIVDCTRTTSSWKQSQINKGQKRCKTSDWERRQHLFISMDDAQLKHGYVRIIIEACTGEGRKAYLFQRLRSYSKIKVC